MKLNTVSLIFLLYGVYWVAFVINLNSLEKNLLWESLKSPELVHYGRLICSNNDQLTEKAGFIKRILYSIIMLFVWILLPLLSLGSMIWYLDFRAFKYPLSGLKKSGIYSVAVNIKHGVTLDDINQSKLDWDTLFTANGVSTPKVYGILKDSKFEGEIPENQPLIWKSNHAAMGKGIFPFQGLDKAPTKGVYLLQERVQNCSGHAEHIRIITRTIQKPSDNPIVDVVHFSQKKGDSGKISSNFHQGGQACFLKRQPCHLPSNISDKLDKVKEIAVMLQSKTDIYSVAWDIVFDCQNYYFLEGNVAYDFFLTKSGFPNYIKDLEQYLKVIE